MQQVDLHILHDCPLDQDKPGLPASLITLINCLAEIRITGNMSNVLASIALAAAVLAIPRGGTLAGDLLRRIRVFSRYIASRSIQAGHCERLLWSDIPDGPLHICTSRSLLGLCCPSNYPYYQGFNFTEDAPWEDSISALFNQVRRWNDPGRQIPRVAKHSGIPLNQTAIRVDLKVVLAFALCTVMGVGEHASYNLEEVYAFKHIDDAFTCHLKGKPLRSLTKLEAELLLRGYPPWYREQIPTKYGFTIGFTMQDDDLYRGGWIIASAVGPIEPVPVYFENDAFRSIDRTYWARATRRVLEILEETFKPAYPDDEDLTRTIVAVSRAVCSGTDSGSWCLLSLNVRSSTPKIDLTPEQCAQLIELFNQKRPLTTPKIASWKPLLIEICRLSFRGVEAVWAYHKNWAHQLRVPRHFTDASEIYLI